MNEIKFLTKQFLFRTISLIIYSAFLIGVITVAVVVMKALSVSHVSETIRALNDIFWLIVLTFCGILGYKIIMRIENKIAAENPNLIEPKDTNDSTAVN